MTDILSNSLGRLRVIGFIEGVSFLVILFVTMPLKYIFHMPEANKICGMAHGLLFIAYVILVIMVAIEHRWNFRKTGLALVASIIPFGTFWADAKLFRKED